MSEAEMVNYAEKVTMVIILILFSALAGLLSIAVGVAFACVKVFFNFMREALPQAHKIMDLVKEVLHDRRERKRQS